MTIVFGIEVSVRTLRRSLLLFSGRVYSVGGNKNSEGSMIRWHTCFYIVPASKYVVNMRKPNFLWNQLCRSLRWHLHQVLVSTWWSQAVPVVAGACEEAMLLADTNTVSYSVLYSVLYSVNWVSTVDKSAIVLKDESFSKVSRELQHISNTSGIKTQVQNKDKYTETVGRRQRSHPAEWKQKQTNKALEKISHILSTEFKYKSYKEFKWS